MKKTDTDSEHRISAAFRAMSGIPEGQAVFKESNQIAAKLDKNNLIIPVINKKNPSYEQLGRIRGTADSAALQIKYHDEKIHKQNIPQDKQKAAIFEAAEQARVESIGALIMDGVSANITDKWESYFSERNDEEDKGEPPVADVIGNIIRSRIAGIKTPESARGIMAKWGVLFEEVTEKNLSQLTGSINNQQQYARIIRRLIDDMPFLENSPHEELKDADNGQQQDENGQNNQQPQTEDNSEQSADKDESGGSNKQKQQDAGADTADGSDIEKKETKERSEADYSPRPNMYEGVHGRAHYSVYTREYDQIIKAEELCGDEELERLRKQLDSRLASLKEATRRHANRFLRKIMAKQRISWDYNLEDGVLDNARFAALIADPNYSEYFKQQKEDDNSDTVVTLLLDNSGSMRGRPIMVAAMCAEILAKTLESCNIKVEILGFTTIEWKGGKSRHKWMDEGSPASPGRLNDLRHIIYKSADTPLRRSRGNIALMLKEGILKENIDGEAIMWACNRLAFRPEKRRILMVISDGAPVDDSTISANNSSYLDNHLKSVIAAVEDKTDIELVAIGIGHDVTRYYSNALTIREVDQLGDAMFTELAELF